MLLKYPDQLSSQAEDERVFRAKLNDLEDQY